MYVVTAGLIIAGGFVSYLFILYFTLPDPSEFMSKEPKTTAFMRLKCADSPCRLRWVPLDKISPFVPEAILLAEDPRFFAHAGFDWQNIREAFLADVRHRGIVWGGSSITMQLAKNLYLSPEKTFGRKLKEILLTIKIERKLGKRRILELYLNVAEWGDRMFGIANASEFYFGRDPSDLGPLEASFLASILPNPPLASKGEMPERFMESGANVFDALLGFYLPRDANPAGPLQCKSRLNGDDELRVDYLVAKLFGRLASDMKTGKASLFGRGDLGNSLTEDETEFVDGLLGRFTDERRLRPIDCDRKFNRSDFAAFRQRDTLENERVYWVRRDAINDLSGMLTDAAKAGVVLKLNSSYRADGFQVFVFLSRLRENGYCLSEAVGHVALPGESEHTCTDRQAIDFGGVSGTAVKEGGPEFKWLEENAPRYDFHLSYPKDAKSGLEFEPWHWCHIVQ